MDVSPEESPTPATVLAVPLTVADTAPSPARDDHHHTSEQSACSNSNSGSGSGCGCGAAAGRPPTSFKDKLRRRVYQREARLAPPTASPASPLPTDGLLPSAHHVGSGSDHSSGSDRDDRSDTDHSGGEGAPTAAAAAPVGTHFSAAAYAPGSRGAANARLTLREKHRAQVERSRESNNTMSSSGHHHGDAAETGEEEGTAAGAVPRAVSEGSTYSDRTDRSAPPLGQGQSLTSEPAGAGRAPPLLVAAAGDPDAPRGPVLPVLLPPLSVELARLREHPSAPPPRLCDGVAHVHLRVSSAQLPPRPLEAHALLHSPSDDSGSDALTPAAHGATARGLSGLQDALRAVATRSVPNTSRPTGGAATARTGGGSTARRNQRHKMIRRESVSVSMPNTARADGSERGNSSNNNTFSMLELTGRTWDSVLFSELADTQGEVLVPAMASPATQKRRTSTFSSLQFSMAGRRAASHRRLGLEAPRQQSQPLAPPTPMDDEVNTQLEEVGSTREEDQLDLNSAPDGRRDVGLWETAEFVLLPRYELLQDGQTAQERSLRGLSVSTSPKQSPERPRAASAAAAPTADEPLLSLTSSPNSLSLHAGSAPRRRRPVFTFGVVSPAYARDPEQDEEGTADGDAIDCKVAARLLFDADVGVMLLAPRDEAGKYVHMSAQPQPHALPHEHPSAQDLLSPLGEDAAADAEDEGACGCTEAHIHQFVRGASDYTEYSAHDLYDHCTLCNRRPAAFLCMRCFRAVCPSHVARHHRRCPSRCTLFLNLLDIMTSFDRIFWCERCQRFTWKYTEVYDGLIDRMAYTRGTYLHRAARDIRCIGWELVLRGEQEEQRAAEMASAVLLEEAQQQSAHVSPVAAAAPFFPSSSSFSLRPPISCSPMHSYLDRERRSLGEKDVVPIGEAVSKISAIGASVQGWRSTQEDAETAFLVDIPALHAGGGGGAPQAREEDAATTIPMAVFCVFDGHGGDAVAKLAANAFERYLREAIRRARPDEVRARALLFHVNTESTVRPRAVSSGYVESGSLSNAASLGHSRPGACSPPHLLVPVGPADSAGAAPALSPSQLLVPAAPTPVPMTAQSLRQLAAQGPDEAAPAAASRTAFLRAWGEARDEAQATPDRSCTSPSAAEAAGEKRRLSAATVLVSVPEMEMLRNYFASIMEDALLSLDQFLQETEEGQRGDYNCVGCTACVVGITSNFILCANVGDSGAALYTPHTIKPISTKHRLSDVAEQARIRAAGYTIANDRIEGLLAVPRALGDFDFKQCGGRSAREQAVSAIPDVSIYAVPSGEEQWGVLLACDGVWDTATLHQIHYALTNTVNDLEVAASATEAVVRAKELYDHRQRGPRAALGTPPASPAAPPHLHGSLSPLSLSGESTEAAAAAATAAGPAAARTATAAEGEGTEEEEEEEQLKDGTSVIEGDLGGDAEAAAAGIDAKLVAMAAGVFAQCVAPCDNEEGIGLDNCSLILIERRYE